MLVVNPHGCMGHLARNSNNRMLDIFSRGKKKVRMVTQMFRLLDIFLNAFSYCYAFSSCFSICFFLNVLLWRFMLFEKCHFFLSCFHLFFWSRAFHPQFATSYFLFWMPCYRCKQRITVFWASGLQQHFNGRDFAEYSEE